MESSEKVSLSSDMLLISLSLICSAIALSEFPDQANFRRKVEYDDDRTKFSFGTISNSYGQPQYLQIPAGPDGGNLRVPKAFYHYSDTELAANAGFALPDDYRFSSIKGMVKNNRRDIKGMYLPLPNMDPINLHFISRRTFEKGVDSTSNDDSPDGALARAKKICLSGDETSCEKALLHYHRLRSASRQPLHKQLLSLGDIASHTKLRDRVGSGLGVVVGVPGYDPVYVGAALDNNNDGDFNMHWSPPR